VYAGERMIRSRQRTSSTALWTTRYYLSDRLSVRMTLDSSGNVLGRQAHFPFGEDFGESGTQEKHHFTMYERDGESGTDYAVNRQYTPGLGRFNRPDTVASTGKKESPQAWNRYTYTTGDPINQKDPWGLFACLICGGPDDPCSPFGPSIIQDGIELDRDFFCGVEPIPAPPNADPDPDPAPTACTLSPRATQGSAVLGKYKSKGNHYGPTPDHIGKGENGVPDGFWWFFFEVQGVLPADDQNPESWRALQSITRIGRVTIFVPGVGYEDFDIQQHKDNDNPGTGFTDITQAGWYYWSDAPDLRKVRRGSDGVMYSIISGHLVLEVNFVLMNKKDPRRSCRGSLTLVLSIDQGVANWK
jgi:RHS repeat-associated protein